MWKHLPYLAILSFFFFTKSLYAQQIDMLAYGKEVSLRGLSVVNDDIIWVSGSSGSVGLSTDGGKNWKWIQVPRYEKSDFRDIEAFSGQEAVIMGVTEPAVILRTIDGGSNWTTVYEDSSKDIFLDAMAFFDRQGIIVGDPVKNKIIIGTSNTRGEKWKIITIDSLPVKKVRFIPGEAFFAASGSNIQWLSNKEWAGVTGGKKSIFFLSSGQYYTLQMIQGSGTAGANSLAINPLHADEAYIVGGDFSHDTARDRNAIHIKLNPFTQTVPLTSPHGYRSCVEWLDSTHLICCGTSGVDISADGGMNWKLISNKSFHICKRSGTGTAVFLAGAKGSIARLKI